MVEARCGTSRFVGRLSFVAGLLRCSQLAAAQPLWRAGAFRASGSPGPIPYCGRSSPPSVPLSAYGHDLVGLEPCRATRKCEARVTVLGLPNTAEDHAVLGRPRPHPPVDLDDSPALAPELRPCTPARVPALITFNADPIADFDTTAVTHCDRPRASIRTAASAGRGDAPPIRRKRGARRERLTARRPPTTSAIVSVTFRAHSASTPPVNTPVSTSGRLMAPPRRARPSSLPRR